MNLRKISLNSVDKITIIYILITSLFMLSGYNKLENLSLHLAIRLGIILLIVYFTTLENSKHKIMRFLRYFYPLVVISYFYNETDYYNNLIFSNIDPLLYHFEQLILGFHPSVYFSQVIPYRWFSELMHFGYFSYYLMAIGILCLFYFKKNTEYQKILFLIIISFYIYYLIFAIIPSIGPQFYLPERETNIPQGYLFYKTMRIILTYAESETGAFPSSHVGMAIIYLIILKDSFKNYFLVLIPFVFILMLSTVYLKAHYAIDVFAGIISAPVIYLISDFIYKKLNTYKSDY